MQIPNLANYLQHLTPEQEKRRRRFMRIAWNLPFIFPRRWVITPEVDARVNQFSRAGGGVLFVSTHFSKRDVLEFPLISARIDMMNSRRADSPIALHQARSSLVKTLGYQIAVNFWPIYIGDTEEALKAGRFKWDEGKPPDKTELVALNENYFVRARECLAMGGAIFLANKPGRRPQLEPTNDKPIHRLLMSKNAEGKWVDEANVILVVVGTSIGSDRTAPTAEEMALSEADRRARYRAFYQAHNGMNWFDRYDVNTTIALLPAERRALCQATGMTIDNVITALLARQVDYRYNAMPEETVKKVYEAYNQIRTGANLV